MALDNCICCRQKNDSSEELCVSCWPWNDAEELKREVIPVWQRLLQASFPEFIGEIGSEMN